jgi:hypothetical protein
MAGTGRDVPKMYQAIGNQGSRAGLSGVLQTVADQAKLSMSRRFLLSWTRAHNPKVIGSDRIPADIMLDRHLSAVADSDALSLYP